MFVPDSFSVALIMMLTCTFCWGSWANTYKLTRGYRFELFYWDYAVGIVATSFLFALTLGSRGGEQSFLANLAAADRSNIVCALLAGAIWNVANLLLVAGIEMAGLAVAFPLAIGVALVEGVVLSYALQPRGNPVLLGTGLALAVAAVVFDGKAYASLPAGSRPVSRRSIVICLLSGILIGIFAPFMTRALTAGHPLTPYGAGVSFTIGALACCFVANIYFMKRPLIGEPVRFGAFFAAPPREHLLGLLGGVIWGVGTMFNFVAASLVGVAIAYAVGQAAPMVAALWGVFVWKEFRGAGARARTYLALMFACYLLALAAIAAAYRSA